MRFWQYDTSVHSSSPAGGPLSGGTLVLLRGRGLRALGGTAPLCRFGGRVAQATLQGDRAVRCFSPAADGAGIVELSTSLDAPLLSTLPYPGQPGISWTPPVRYTYYEASVHSLQPATGQAQEPAFALHGEGFDLGVDSAQFGAISTPLMDASDGLIASELAAAIGHLSPPLLPASVIQTDRNASGVLGRNGGGWGGGGALLLVGSADCTIVALRLGGPGGGGVQVEHGHGAVAVGALLRGAGEVHCAPAIGDIDGDGKEDLLVGLGSGKVVSFRGLLNESVPSFAKWG